MALVLTQSGCGNVIYTYRAHSATARIEEAKQAGAERNAPYEYTLAREHLRKAMSEASEADYGDAYELAGLADDYAQRALDKAQYRITTSPPKFAAANEQEKTKTGSGSIHLGEPK